MNSDRRKRIKTVIQTIQTCTDIIDMVRDEEETAMDNMPENMQDSDRYSAMEDAVTNLEDAIEALDESVQKLEEAAS